MGNDGSGGRQDVPRAAPGDGQVLQGPRPGAAVVARGSRWRVLDSVDHGGCRSCRLVGMGPANAGVSRTLIWPFDRPRPLDQPVGWRHVGRRRWMHACRTVAASHEGVESLRGAAGARLDVMRYQLEPALAMLAGESRVLIADEVGLGKTIQAALILADLRARSIGPRCLIVCPAGLCAQWHDELADRFDIPSTVVDLPELRRRASAVAGAGSPWDRMDVPIVSVDFLKQPEVLAGTSAIRWDLLIVDEAHLSAVAPARAAAVGWLASRARRIVLLTATPHSGEPAAFEALCRVGRLPGDAPLAMFRRTRSSLGMAAGRRVTVLGVHLSPPESRMHALLRRYTRRVWKAGGDPRQATDARLAMVVLAKRAASGPSSLLASVERRRASLSAAPVPGAWQLPLPLGEPETDAEDDEPGAEVLGIPGLADVELELRELDRLAASARSAAAVDRKLAVLVRLIRKAGEPAVVFTEYRDTLVRIDEVLGRTVETAVLHGGLDSRRRAEAVRRFTTGSAAVLLATDAAAHGLNLQARCRLLVNVDLPWNPVRLEQRIGRVDRLGQQRRVHAIHLVGRGTSERAIARRLSERDAAAREGLGEGGPESELDIAAAVMPHRRASKRAVSRREGASPPVRTQGIAPTAVASALVRKMEAIAPASVEAERLALVRRLLHGATARGPVLSAPDRAGPRWTALTLRSGSTRLRVVAVLRAEIVDGRGALQARIVTPVELRGMEPTRSEWPELAARLTEAVRVEAAGAIERLQPVVRARAEAAGRRETALSAVVGEAPPVAIQPGLFDRRALARAAAALDERLKLEEDASAYLEGLRNMEVLSLASPPRLLLVAFVRER